MTSLKFLAISLLLNTCIFIKQNCLYWSFYLIHFKHPVLTFCGSGWGFYCPLFLSLCIHSFHVTFVSDFSYIAQLDHRFRICRFNQVQLGNIQVKKKISRKFENAKLEFAVTHQLFTWHSCCIYNFLHNTYIVLSIINNLEMIIL